MPAIDRRYGHPCRSSTISDTDFERRDETLALPAEEQLRPTRACSDPANANCRVGRFRRVSRRTPKETPASCGNRPDQQRGRVRRRLLLRQLALLAQIRSADGSASGGGRCCSLCEAGVARSDEAVAYAPTIAPEADFPDSEEHQLEERPSTVVDVLKSATDWLRFRFLRGEGRVRRTIRRATRPRALGATRRIVAQPIGQAAGCRAAPDATWVRSRGRGAVGVGECDLEQAVRDRV
jgi:hypothetical protein